MWAKCILMVMMYIDLSQIEGYLGYASIAFVALTVLFFLILFLCFLRGLLRGWVKGTYHIIFMAILFVVALSTIDAVGNLAKDFNVSFIGTITIPLESDPPMTITATTVSETLYNVLITVLRDKFNIQADPAALSNYVLALSLSIIKFVLIFVEGILILIVGNLLAFILWHLLFKWFFPRKIRKPKLRWISGLQNTVVAIVTCAMIFAPLTSTVNAVTRHVDIDDEAAQNNQMLRLADNVLDSYNNSLFSQLFFSWWVPNGEDTLDVALMNFFTETKVGDTTVSLLKDLSLYSEIGSTAANLFFGNYFEDGIAWKSILSSTEEVTTIIRNLAKTDLFQTVVPFAFKVAASLDFIVERIGEDTANYIANLDVDWESEVELYCDLYVNIAESGAFDFLSDEHSQMPQLVFDDPYSIIFNDNFHQKLENILNDLDATAFLNAAISGLIYTMADTNPDWVKDDDPSTVQFVDFLPLNGDGTVDKAALDGYQWGQEIVCIIDPLFTIHDSNPTAFKEVVDIALNNFLPSSGGTSEAPSSEETSEDFTKQIMSAAFGLLAESSDAIISAVVGERDSDGNPIVGTDGKATGDDLCIMDSHLVTNFMRTLPDLLASTVSNLSEEMGEIDVTTAKTALFGDNKEATIRTNFKKELGAILDIVGEVIRVPEGKALLQNYEQHPGIDFDPAGQLMGIDSNLVKALQKGIRNIDKSYLLNDMLPSLAENFLGNNDMLSSLGIEQLHFRDVDLGHELADLLDIFIYCPDIVSFAGSMSGNSSMDRILGLLEDADTCDQLVRMVDIIGGCDIINPAEEHNTAIYGLFSSLTGSTGISFTEEDFANADLFSEYNADNVRTKKGEIYYLVESLSIIAKGNFLQSMTGGSGSTEDMIAGLAKIDMEELFTSIGHSTLLRKAIATYLDENMLDGILQANEIGVPGVRLANLNTGNENQIIANWTNEGKAFNAIFALAARGIDFSNLDLFGSAGETVVELLRKFAYSGIFVSYDLQGNATYLFPEYFYNRILSALDGNTLGYFADEGMRDVAKALPSDADLASKRAVTTTLHSNCVAIDTPDGWGGVNGELNLFSTLLNAVNGFGDGGIGNLDSATIAKLRPTLMALSNSNLVGNVAIANAIEDAMGGLAMGDFDFSNANVGYFWEINDLGPEAAKAAREEEIDHLLTVIETLFDEHFGVYRNGSVDMGALNINSISGDYFLRPVLLNARLSQVLSTSAVEGAVTPFETVVATFIKHSSIVGVVSNIETPLSDPNNSSVKYCDLSIVEIVRELDTIEEWENEIDIICELMDTAKATVFVAPDGTIDFSPLDDPKTFFNSDVTGRNKADLLNLVRCLNQAKLFYRALPFQLHGALSSISVLGEGDFITDVSYADPYYTTYQRNYLGNYVNDILPFDEEEIDSLLYVMETFGSKASNIDFTAITDIDADAITEMLGVMHDSRIFNYYNAISSPTRALESIKQGMTSFQAIVGDFLQTDVIASYYYSQFSPKDHDNYVNGIYDEHTKSFIEVKRLLPSLGDPAFSASDINLITGETNSLRAMLNVLVSPELRSVIHSGGIDVDYLNYELFMMLMTAFNDCPLTQDIVPNVIVDMVRNQPSFAVSLDGVNFDRGNFYFSYWWYTDGYNAPIYHDEPDYNQKFYEAELEQMGSILSFLNSNFSQIQTLSSFSITDFDAYLVRDLLLELNASYCFHFTGPENLSFNSYAENTLLKVSANGATPVELAPLSVFEQLMFKLYYDSGLASEAFDETFDLAYYLTYGNDGAKVKLYDRMKAFAQGTLNTSHSGDWFTEIEAFTTDGRHHDGFSLEDPEIGCIEVVKSLASAMGMDSQGGISLDADAFRKLSPAQIRWLLASVNRVDMTCDILPYSVRSLITIGDSGGSGIGIQKYTSSVVTYANDTSSFALPASDFFTDYQSALVTSVTFSFSGDSSQHFAVYADLGGTMADVTDFTDAGLAVASGGYVTINTSKLACAFTIASNDSNGIISDVAVTFDTANFNQSQQSFATRDIDALYYFLASVYRGENNHSGESSNLYFTFDSANGVEEFLEEGPDTSDRSKFYHSTYGMMNLFLNSNIYAQTFGDNGLLADSNPAYSAGDLAIYTLFNIDTEFDGTPVTVRIGDNFGTGSAIDHLRYLYDMHMDYYDQSMSIYHTLLESAFLDEYIKGAAAFQAYIDAARIALVTSPEDVAFFGANYFFGTNEAGNVAQDYLGKVLMEDYNNEVHGHYDAATGTSPEGFTIRLEDVRDQITHNNQPLASNEPGFIGKSILAGQLNSLVEINIASVALPNSSRTNMLMSPTHTGERMGYLPDATVLGLSSVNDFEGMLEATEDAREVIAYMPKIFAGATTLWTATAYTADEKDDLQSIANWDFDKIHNAYYLGTVYTNFLIRGVFYNANAYYQNDFVDLVNATNVMQNSPMGVQNDLAFSYASVAQAIMASAY